MKAKTINSVILLIKEKSNIKNAINTNKVKFKKNI